MPSRLLLVEDEPGLQRVIGDRLKAEGYRVTVVDLGREAVERILQRSADLVVLDVMLPDLSGMAVCRTVRDAGITTPILMLTALQDVDHRVQGLGCGADDYLGKPFAMPELLARIEALLRRAGVSELIQVGCAQVDRAATRVVRDDEDVVLSALQYRLLDYLIRHRGTTVSRDQLLREVWGHKGTSTTRTVDVHVAALRRVVEADPAHPTTLVTVHGQGYRLER